jgi:hypothetical protein
MSPLDLGLVDLSPAEMMCWLYCPIKLPGMQGFVFPDNLWQFVDIPRAAQADFISIEGRPRWRDSYVYLTAKTLYVSPESPGNRPGWHSDGFMTDDLNYIWSDRSGTEFWKPNYARSFTLDHQLSLSEMEQAVANEPMIVTYPDKHLLRLDEFVIHRVARQSPGMRTFVKVSVSTNPYNLIGNSINHGMPTGWTYSPRASERNHTSAEKH